MHCHNIYGIAPCGAKHVIETAAYAHISLSAVVQKGSLDLYWELFDSEILICDILKLYCRVKSEKDFFRVKMSNELKD